MGTMGQTHIHSEGAHFAGGAGSKDPSEILASWVRDRIELSITMRAVDHPAFHTSDWYLEITAEDRGSLWLETGLTTACGRPLDPDVARAMYRVATSFLNAAGVQATFVNRSRGPRLRMNPPGTFRATS